MAIFFGGNMKDKYPFKEIEEKWRKYWERNRVCEVDLKNVEHFIISFLRSEGKKIATDEDGQYEFIVPDIIKTYGG